MRVFGGALAYVGGVLFTRASVSSSLLLAQGVVFGLTMPLEVWAIDGLMNAVSGVLATAVEPWASVLPWFGLLAVAFTIRSLESAVRRYLAVLTHEQVDQAMHR